MSNILDLEIMRSAVAGTAAAFRCVTDYQPVGGPGDKVFPPTYEGGKYATEERINPETGEERKCVLLDSVQSQANRMELALLEAHRAGHLRLPLLVTRFDREELPKKFAVTSLEAPHRVADALFRDSLLNGVIFRKSATGRILDTADIRNATGLFGICPTALIFGMWDSTGPRGGLGAKFKRALVSEVVGYDAVAGVDTASRIDPAEIRRQAATLYESALKDSDAPAWTLDKTGAAQEKNKPKKLGRDGKPSEANHGNVTPDFAFARNQNRQIIYDTTRDTHGQERREPRILGGFTISKAVQTTVLSLSALRRLCFPLHSAADSKQEIDIAARTALAALGLAAGTLARTDMDLRSRCQLVAQTETRWQLLDHPGKVPSEFELEPDSAIRLAGEAIDIAKQFGLPWEGVIELSPSESLLELVIQSQKLSSAEGTAEG